MLKCLFVCPSRQNVAPESDTSISYLMPINVPQQRLEQWPTAGRERGPSWSSHVRSHQRPPTLTHARARRQRHVV